MEQALDEAYERVEEGVRPRFSQDLQSGDLMRQGELWEVFFDIHHGFIGVSLGGERRTGGMSKARLPIEGQERLGRWGGCVVVERCGQRPPVEVREKNHEENVGMGLKRRWKRRHDRGFIHLEACEARMS